MNSNEMSFSVEIQCYDENTLTSYTIKNSFISDNIEELREYVYNKYKHLQPNIKGYKFYTSTLQKGSLIPFLAQRMIRYCNHFN